MGIKWEVTPSLLQEPHSFNCWSSQDSVEDAEKALSLYAEYGGYIEQTTYGQLNSIMF